jgi:hypothetical protein
LQTLELQGSKLVGRCALYRLEHYGAARSGTA